MLNSGHRGPRVAAAPCVAATSGLVAQHSQHSTCYGSYTPLTGLLWWASISPRPLILMTQRVACVLPCHSFYAESCVGVI